MYRLAGAGLSFTQGDDAVLTLFAQDQFGNAVNLTGASFSTELQGPAGPVSFDNGHHAIVSAALGEFTLTLSEAESATVGAAPLKDVVTQVTISSKKTTYRGSQILTVLAPAPNS